MTLLSDCGHGAFGCETEKVKEAVTEFLDRSQFDIQIVNIGDFTTTKEEVIKDCKIGYRTLGKLNADKSNVVLCPTWFMATSNIINSNLIINTIDTTGKYLIVVDALGNIVSSSPSNHVEFPEISIRDMVNSQHELLTKHLKIDHINMVYGASMEGMQVFEWMVAYPEFMDKAISIIGTPKASFYDKLVWQSMVKLLEDARNDEAALAYAWKRVKEIDLIATYTPTYLSRTQTS